MHKFNCMYTSVKVLIKLYLYEIIKTRTFVYLHKNF